MRGRLRLVSPALFLLVGLAGCGGGGPSYAPVTGKVTLDGKPVAKAVVTFSPVPKPGSTMAGDSASGTTDEAGAFTLRTYSQGGWKDGAQVGPHKVSISRQETRGEGDRSVTTEKLPKRYNLETELTFEVKSGNNQKDFDLKSH
jgi:predicted small lipoprotein YifL